MVVLVRVSIESLKELSKSILSKTKILDNKKTLILNNNSICYLVKGEGKGLGSNFLDNVI